MDTEERFLNPLGVRVGDSVGLDLLDLRDLDLQVTGFRVVTRKIGGREFPLTDYYLKDVGLDGGTSYILRYIQLDEPDKASELTHQALLLQLLDESERDEDEMQVLGDGGGAGFVFFTASKTTDGEWDEHDYPSRVNGITNPYECDVVIVRDADHDGDVDMDEVEEHRMTYWDFWRTGSDEVGTDQTEYLFVEVDDNDGWTEKFTGVEIDQDVITKL